MEDTSTAPEVKYEFTTHAIRGGVVGVHVSLTEKEGGKKVNVFLDLNEASRLLSALLESHTFALRHALQVAENRAVRQGL